MKVHTFTIELRDVAFNIANDSAELERICTELVKLLNHTILQTQFHTFNPQGVTGFLLLAESHLAVHSWPEKNYVHLTFATCKTCGEAEKHIITETIHQLSKECSISEIVSEF